MNNLIWALKVISCALKLIKSSPRREKYKLFFMLTVSEIKNVKRHPYCTILMANRIVCTFLAKKNHKNLKVFATK